MGLPAYRTDDLYTYEDYLSWDDDGRRELIDGIVYDMSPAPSTVHQEIVVEITTQLHTVLRGHPCRVFCAPFDVRLASPLDTSSAIKTVVQPDIAIICDKTKIDEKGCKGAPDFVLEVLSRTTAAKDQIEKVALYERHGVREYWTLHPVDKILTIRNLEQSPTGKRFGIPRTVIAQGQIALESVPEIEINLAFLGGETERSDATASDVEHEPSTPD